MQPIFLLIGPPAVGKSSTSKALAAQFSKSIHIPVDTIRDMVVSGLVLPAMEWRAELVEQVRLARESAIFMAQGYQRADFAVVIDDFFDPNRLSEYQALVDEPEVYKVVLYPDQQVAHARNLQRSGQDPAREYIDEGIRIVYQQLETEIATLRQNGWIILDTTNLSIEQTVLTILNNHSR